MSELEADFEISNNNHFDCSFEILKQGANWGSITGDIENQTDLNNALNSKADASEVEQISETIGSYGNIVTHNADEFATAEQGELADSALQPGDNITELVNNAGYITSSALDDYATTESLNEGLATKQDTISDLSDIRNNASKGADAYDTIQGYGNIVTYNASDFATSIQGALANTALQPNDDITQLNNNAGYITSASLPTVNNATVKFQKNGTDLKSITLNQSANETINFIIPTQASDISAVPTSRTVNSKSLASNISLNSTDVGALPSTTTINDLTTTTQQNALNSNITSTLTSQITTNKNDIEDIQEVIPSAATSSNQLADKSFVNSTVATNTANFIGTFTSVADLETYSGTLTNNDYAFVETTDTAGNTLYDRYKYTTATTPASWQFEYELNNSSFTSTQWAAINSGANTTNIGQIATNTNDISDINTTISGYGDIVTYNASSFATASQGTKADTALQPNDNISDLINDSGYITGITSSDVTAALGYTPYDSSNPNGYTSNTGTVTSVNNISPVNGNVTLTIPAAQVNSDWNSSSGVSEILNKPTIPTVYNSTITFTQGGVQKGSITLNQSSGDTIAFDAGGVTVDQTYDPTSVNAQSGVAINGAGFLQNNSTVTGGLAIGGSSIASDSYSTAIGNSSVITGINGVAVGYSAQSGDGGVAVGKNALASTFGIALGYSAEATASKAIQIGPGTNGTASTLAVCFEPFGSNYILLDGTTGLIPDDRISTNIARAANIPSSLSDITVVQGSNITINGDTISATNTTYSNFAGADSITSGTSGLVPAPSAGDEEKFLSGGGSFEQIDYSQISNTPTIPTVPTNISAFTNDLGYVTGTVKTIQDVNSLSSGTIDLSMTESFYKITPSAATTFTFSTLNLTLSASIAYTFELCVVMSTVYTLTFPSTVKWQDNTTPTMTSAGTYFFAFRTIDAGSTWKGSLQGVWQ